MADSELQQLVRRAQKGSAEAYEQLVRRYSPRLLGYFVRSVTNRADAEDLLQEVFLRVVGSLKKYRERERFEYWLFRLAHNLVIDYWRKRRTTLTVSQDRGGQVTAETTVSSKDPGPDRVAAAKDDADRLGRALEMLPIEQRDTLLMRYFGGLSYAEIAKSAGCPLGTVLARAHRGVAKLREALKERDHE